MLRSLVGLLRGEATTLSTLNANSQVVANVLRQQKHGWVRRRLRMVTEEHEVSGDCEMQLASPTRSLFGFGAYEQLSLTTWTSPNGVARVKSPGKVDAHTIETKQFFHDQAIDTNAFQVSVQYLLHRRSFVVRDDAPKADVEAVASEAVQLLKSIHSNDISCEYVIDLNLLRAGKVSPIVAARFVDSRSELPDDIEPQTRLIRRCWNGRFDVMMENNDPNFRRDEK
jgi:hypothetical protein